MEKRQTNVFNRGALIALPVLAIFLWAFFEGGMDQQNPWRLLPAFLAVVALLAAASVLSVRRRTRTLRLAAEELGLQFAPVGDAASMQAIFDSSDMEAVTPELQRLMTEMGAPPAVQQAMMEKMASAKSRPGLELSALRRLTPFKNVDHPRARNVMSGPLGGAEALVFDYTYHTKSGPGSRTKYISVSQTVAVFRFRGRPFPVFELSAEGLLNMGGQDFDFASHPAFSKRFRLRGDDETAVRNLFNPGVLTFFETLHDDFRETIEVHGEYVMVYRHGRSIKAETVPAFAKEAATVAAKLANR